MIANVPYVTKVLTPGKLPALVPRRRLLDALQRNLPSRIALVCAGAGYGKTTLLADFAREADRPVAWYSLDEHDGDARTFISYLVASVRHRLPGFGRELEHVLAEERSGQEWLDTLAATLVNEVFSISPSQLLVVLDDCHLVPEESQTWRLLDLAMRRLPDNCQVILSARARPPLPALPRLLGQEQALVLGTEQLRFTEEEVRAFLGLAGLDSDAYLEKVRSLEGWAAGLILGSLATDGVRARSGLNDDWIFEYLAREVLDRQPEQVRSFLLETSILRQLSPDVCDELRESASSGAMLSQVQATNLFLIPLEGGEQSWYRYHALFQDFLRARLSAEQPKRVVQLHRRAARLAEARQAWEESLYHLAELADRRAASRLLERCGEDLLAKGHWAALAHWLDWLSPEALRERPALQLMRARAALRLGSPDRAVELAREVLKRADGHPWGENVKALNIQANALRVQGAYTEALAVAQEAAGACMDDPGLKAESLRQVGMCLLALGDIERGADVLQRCLEELDGHDGSSQKAEVHQELGVALVRAGKLDSAETHYQAAERWWRATGNNARLAQTLNNLGVLLSWRGEYEAAASLYSEAAEAASRAGYLRFLAYAMVSLGDVRRDSGQLAEAEKAYAEGGRLAERTREAFLTAYVDDALGAVRRLQGDLKTAERLSQRALAQAQQRGSAYEQALYETSLGIVEYQKGSLERAIARLRRAAELASRCRARPLLARAYLHLAQALFLDRQHDAALAELDAMAGVLDQLGYEGFLATEARRAPLLLQFAASRQAGGRFVSRWAAELSAPPAEADGALVASGVADPRVVAYALGKSRVEVDGQEVSELQWRSAGSRQLLFFLLLEPGWHTRDELMDRIWPELPAGSGAVNTFHSHLHRLRRALFPSCLLQRGGRYRLSPDLNVWFDVAQFERLAAEAERQPEGSHRAGVYLEALRLYNGPFMADCYADWCGPHRLRLEGCYLAVLRGLANHYAAADDHQRAAELWSRLLVADGFNEEAHRGLMLAQAQAGDRESALRHYRLWAQQLREELGSRPEPSTQHLYDELRGRRELASVTAAVTG